MEELEVKKKIDEEELIKFSSQSYEELLKYVFAYLNDIYGVYQGRKTLTLDDVKRLLEDLAEECEMISSFAKELIKFYRL